MNPVKKTALRTKKFVSDHRVSIAVTVTSAVWLAFIASRAKEWNEFLEEHGLTDQFYQPIDEEGFAI